MHWRRDSPGLKKSEPWGNLPRHEYDRVRVDRLWAIIVEDLPALRAACEPVKQAWPG